MSFSVDSFKSALSGGGVRPNQFQVILTFPSFVTGSGALATANAPFLVTAASLPGSIVGVAGTMYRGREVKLAGDRQYAPWAINVINDSTMSLRNAFEEWQNGMDQLQNKSGYIDPLDYTAQIIVQQLDRNDTVVKQYVLNSAWPTNVSDIALDFGANDQIEQFSVELVYQDYTTQFIPLTSGETFTGAA